MDLSNSEIRDVIISRRSDLSSHMGALLPHPLTFDWINAWKKTAEAKLHATIEAMLAAELQERGDKGAIRVP